MPIVIQTASIVRINTSLVETQGHPSQGLATSTLASEDLAGGLCTSLALIRVGSHEVHMCAALVIYACGRSEGLHALSSGVMSMLIIPM